MAIDGHVLEQAFDANDLENNIKYGMAVFKAELDRNIIDTPTVDISEYIGVVEVVEELPEIEELVVEEPTPEEV
jgi:hypothetical protein